MSNNHRIVFKRRFLVAGLPEPLTPRDAHWQIFDNFIERTRLKLRKIRVPETKLWTRVFEQKSFFDDGDFSKYKLARIFLDDSEYKALEIFKGREIRKNRYFCEVADRRISIDIFLGNLWGLNIGSVEFENEKDFSGFELPPFAVSEITGNEFYLGRNLVDKTFADVRAEFAERKR